MWKGIEKSYELRSRGKMEESAINENVVLSQAPTVNPPNPIPPVSAPPANLVITSTVSAPPALESTHLNLLQHR